MARIRLSPRRSPCSLRVSRRVMRSTASTPRRRGARCSSSELIRRRTGKLNDLLARFRNDTMRIFEKHGMDNVGYWVPTDSPASANTLIYILAHDSRDAATKSWAAFREDPEWLAVRRADTGERADHLERPVRVPRLDGFLAHEVVAGPPPGRFELCTLVAFRPRTNLALRSRARRRLGLLGRARAERLDGRRALHGCQPRARGRGLARVASLVRGRRAHRVAPSPGRPDLFVEKRSRARPRARRRLA